MVVHGLDLVSNRVVSSVATHDVKIEEVNENVAHYYEIFPMLDANSFMVDSNLLRVVNDKDSDSAVLPYGDSLDDLDVVHAVEPKIKETSIKKEKNKGGKSFLPIPSKPSYISLHSLVS